METTLATYESDDHDTPSDALAPGTVLLNGQYTIDQYLASGGFGITYKARDSLDRVVVIKECFPEAICTRKNKTVTARSRAHLNEYQSLVDMFVREARSVAKLEHPNIVHVHQVFEDNQTAYMALDYIDGHDLLDWIESGTALSPEQIKGLMIKVLTAIDAIHSQDMLHRDISPDNILIDKTGAPILIDFGAAREEASKKSRALSAMLVVKDGYSPQEFYISGSKQTACSDLYALGATFYHVITGEAPPNSQTRLAEIASHKLDPYKPLAGRVAGYELKFLESIDEAMNVFPKDRIQSASEWIMRVDEIKRREVALATADHDEQIAQTVMELVSQAEAIPEEPPKPEPVPDPVIEKPKPVLHLDPLEEDFETEPEEASDFDVLSEPDDIFDDTADDLEAEFDAEDQPSLMPEHEMAVEPAAPQVAPEQIAVTRGGIVRTIAVTVILWSIIVTIFDGWPAQIGYAAEPFLKQFIDFTSDKTV